ncbi:MAG: TrpB-like pyridoxal phosphate-dependent enzyme [Planctomycetes bacterium]|nr:TrpB-like pyridoxal phosphate-dependent enzyme [Planctomycetota bacterium]
MDRRIYLKAKDMPKQWYNVLADIPKPLPPPLTPDGQPIGPEMLAPIFPMSLIAQEVSSDRWIDIPEPVREVLAIWRPTPLVRALNLEKYLETPAKIYYKNESVSPPGSHKPNTAVAQAYYNKEAGVKRLTTETGAGQWGSALSFACQIFGLECMVYMVRVSFDQKPYRKAMMNLWGANVVPSPSDQTNAGRKVLEMMPDTPGSLGIAISEAVEDAVGREDTKYSLGSVLNHVILHQTVVGLETRKQLKIAGDSPDVLIGCVGGGSNFGGFFVPFIPDKLEGKDIDIIAVEPAACPTMSRGIYAYDYGDLAKMTPLLKMHTLGHDFIPPGIHAGGLRYHGMAPIVSGLAEQGLIRAVNVHQLSCFEAATVFGRTEGIIVAPETSHAVRVVIDEALKCKETGEPKTIVFNLSGHGHVDMAAYAAYYAGQLHDYDYPDDDIKRAQANLPKLD